MSKDQKVYGRYSPTFAGGGLINFHAGVVGYDCTTTIEGHFEEQALYDYDGDPWYTEIGSHIKGLLAGCGMGWMMFFLSFFGLLVVWFIHFHVEKEEGICVFFLFRFVYYSFVCVMDSLACWF